MSSSEWLPPPVPFEIVRRGYSPDQVTAHIEKLEYDLRIATANREATSERLAELTGQLSAAQAEADALRAQLDRQALEPMSMGGLSDRMQRMIRIAEEESADTRTAAEEYSTDLRERTEAETAELRRTAETEVAQLRANAEKAAAELRAKSEAEAAEVHATLQTRLSEQADARAAFDAERDRTRTQLSEQVSALLVEATAHAEATRAQAREDSERMVAEAEAKADLLVTQARAEAERLEAEAAARRAELEEDFTLAINARRLEAHRAVTEAEQTSREDAATRVAQAKEHSERLVASATEHADQLVARAAAESRQRVKEADEAVAALMSLRAELHHQIARLGEHLSQVHGMVDSAGPILAPPPAEQGRPGPDDFPVDPSQRPTSAPGFDTAPPQWQPPEPPADPADRRAQQAVSEQAVTEHPVDSASQAAGIQDGDSAVTGNPDGAVDNERTVRSSAG